MKRTYLQLVGLVLVSTMPFAGSAGPTLVRWLHVRSDGNVTFFSESDTHVGHPGGVLGRFDFDATCNNFQVALPLSPERNLFPLGPSNRRHSARAGPESFQAP